MSKFGHVHSITREVGGVVYRFRAKLEYKWAVWCQLRKEQGIINGWWFEDAPVRIETKYLKNKKMYLPDFTVQMPDGSYELEETKGFFPPRDYTKIKLTAEQYENPITLIFARLTRGNSKTKGGKSQRDQYLRAKRLEPFLKRVIYDAGKTIFKPIEHLFDL